MVIFRTVNLVKEDICYRNLGKRAEQWEKCTHCWFPPQIPNFPVAMNEPHLMSISRWEKVDSLPPLKTRSPMKPPLVTFHKNWSDIRKAKWNLPSVFHPDTFTVFTHQQEGSESDSERNMLKMHTLMCSVWGGGHLESDVDERRCLSNLPVDARSLGLRWWYSNRAMLK